MAPATLQPPRPLSRNEAVEYLGIKRQTPAVWASVGRYDLPYIKVGRCPKYRVEDLDAFLERNTQTQTG